MPPNSRNTISQKTADLPWETVLKSAGSMAGIVCGVGWIVLLVTPANQKTINGYKSVTPLSYILGKRSKDHGGISLLHLITFLKP